MAEEMKTTLNGFSSDVKSMQTRQTLINHSFASAPSETLDCQAPNVDGVLSEHMAVVSGTAEDLQNLEQIILAYKKNEQALIEDVSRLEKEVKKADADLDFCEEEIGACHNEIDRLKDEIEKKTQEIAQYKKQGSVDTQKIDDLNREITGLKQELQTQKSRADDLSNEKDGLAITYNATKTSLDQANEPMLDLTRSIQALFDNIKTLEESRSNLKRTLDANKPASVEKSTATRKQRNFDFRFAKK